MERQYQLYSSWRRAVKKVCPEATFEGDKDIAFAMYAGKSIGEWDGAIGVVYYPD